MTHAGAQRWAVRVMEAKKEEVVAQGSSTYVCVCVGVICGCVFVISVVHMSCV